MSKQMMSFVSVMPNYSVDWLLIDWIGVLFIFVMIFIYIAAALISNRNYRTWPTHRYICWLAGAACIGLSLSGPLARLAHTNFTAHMVGHLLLGMLGPLLIAFSAPMTLLLRTLPVPVSRRITNGLKNQAIRTLMHPATASVLNIGGLWVLYTTGLYMLMHHNPSLHILIHIHIFAAGYFFTVSLIYVDVTPHRYSYRVRAVILIIAIAGHGILSKHIYVQPPQGVPAEQGRLGSMLMYYGGDAIDLILVFWLCMQWYKSARPLTFVTTIHNRD
ncbi:cytochrome c oxidase assembly protein [Paenibacillus solani]|uniref:cytochrome c oxidase assembly protein n=1 Tax=Paenibacillus solani TaxID=1705565 RepID=UPI003D2912B3